MLLAAQARGWSLFYMEQRDLYQGEAQGLCAHALIDGVRRPGPLVRAGRGAGQRPGRTGRDPDAQGPAFLRPEFVYSTYLLEQAESEGVLVVNRPQSLRDCNEKLFATLFPQCTPPTPVSRRPDTIRAFAEHGDVILKPRDGMGGTSIFRHRAGDPNLSVILETLTPLGTQQIMAQGPTCRRSRTVTNAS